MTIDHDSGWREITPKEPSPMGSLVRLHDFARMEYRLQSLEAQVNDLMGQLQTTKDELDLVTQERDGFLLRLQILGEQS